MASNNNPLTRQVGGGHYQGQGPQHVEFCQMNRIPWCESCAIKYIMRHRRKNGREDIEKAIHYVEFMVAMDYGRRDKIPQDMDPKKWIISAEDFLKDKPLTKQEREAINLILDHQKNGGDERKLDKVLKILKDILVLDYGVAMDGAELL